MGACCLPLVCDWQLGQVAFNFQLELHAGDGERVEVGLLDAPLLDGHFAAQRVDQTRDRPALDLCNRLVGVDGNPAVDRVGELLELHAISCAGELHDQRDMGVIIAFEIGLVAQKFGAVIFVVNGVGAAMLRELGALMTAIVFAGRTGAAFAAQIGTQKVNEEVNAITTFGLDPIHFLVLPRLVAAMLVVPLLAVLADIVGILGGALVMTTFDISFLQF